MTAWGLGLFSLKHIGGESAGEAQGGQRCLRVFSSRCQAYLLAELIAVNSRFVHFPSANTEEAMALGRNAASVVSARFPAEMELKFEAICRPFLLLHVNRFAGTLSATHGRRPAYLARKATVALT